MEICSVPGCGRPAHAREFCKSHWQRNRKTGAPGAAFPAAAPLLCAVDGCERSRVTRAGYCAGHHRRIRDTGEPGEPFGARPGQPGRPGRAAPDASCSYFGCDRPSYEGGHCVKHYTRMRRTGDPGLARGRQQPSCLADDCGEPPYARNMCQYHYKVSRAKRDVGGATYTQRRNLLRRYGLAPEDYDALLSEQQGRCAICGTSQPYKKGVARDPGFWPVDHDHESGRRRGLLCASCNTGLALLGDSPDVLRAALAYLTRHGKS